MTGCEGILGVVGGHRSSDLSSVMPMITVSSFECDIFSWHELLLVFDDSTNELVLTIS